MSFLLYLKGAVDAMEREYPTKSKLEVWRDAFLAITSGFFEGFPATVTKTSRGPVAARVLGQAERPDPTQSRVFYLLSDGTVLFRTISEEQAEVLPLNNTRVIFTLSRLADALLRRPDIPEVVIPPGCVFVACRAKRFDESVSPHQFAFQAEKGTCVFEDELKRALAGTPGAEFGDFKIGLPGRTDFAKLRVRSHGNDRSRISRLEVHRAEFLLPEDYDPVAEGFFKELSASIE